MTRPAHDETLTDLVIVGVGGHAREALDVVEAINRSRARYRIIGFIDDDRRTHGTFVRKYAVLGASEWLTTSSLNIRYFIGIGSCPARAQ